MPLSSNGKPGKLETESFNRRSSLPAQGSPVNIQGTYFDKDHGVDVYADPGYYFAVYSNGAVRQVKIPEGYKSVDEMRNSGKFDMKTGQNSDHLEGIRGDVGAGGSGGSGGGTISVDNSIDAAYQRAVRGGRFEGDEKEGNEREDGSGKQRRAEAQLRWEKTADGQKWLSENGFGTSGSGGGTGTPNYTPTYAYKDTESYKQLSEDDRAFIDLAYGSFAAESQEQLQKLTSAIDQALALANPFFKAQMALAKSAVVDQIAKITNDYSFKEREISRLRDELFEDVANNLEQLTLEEQAQIAEITREFDQEILSARDKSAELGRSLDTGRGSLEEAQDVITARTGGIIESLNRRTSFQTRQLQLRAERGDTSAQEQLQQLQASRGYDLGALTRSAESTLGSQDAATIEGLLQGKLVGGVEGDIETERKQSIRQKIADFFDLQLGEV